MRNFKGLGDIDTNTLEGRLLIMAVEEMKKTVPYNDCEQDILDSLFERAKIRYKHVKDLTQLKEIPTFKEALKSLINRYSIESGSNTPDYFLVEYILDCLEAYSRTVYRRDKHYGFKPWITNDDLVNEYAANVERKASDHHLSVINEASINPSEHLDEYNQKQKATQPLLFNVSVVLNESQRASLEWMAQMEDYTVAEYIERRIVDMARSARHEMKEHQKHMEYKERQELKVDMGETYEFANQVKKFTNIIETLVDKIK